MSGVVCVHSLREDTAVRTYPVLPLRLIPEPVADMAHRGMRALRPRVARTSVGVAGGPTLLAMLAMLPEDALWLDYGWICGLLRSRSGLADPLACVPDTVGLAPEVIHDRSGGRHKGIPPGNRDIPELTQSREREQQPRHHAETRQR